MPRVCTQFSSSAHYLLQDTEGKLMLVLNARYLYIVHTCFVVPFISQLYSVYSRSFQVELNLFNSHPYQNLSRKVPQI
jgi:hypothetical protein